MFFLHQCTLEVHTRLSIRPCNTLQATLEPSSGSAAILSTAAKQLSSECTKVFHVGNRT
jgi:hypothetical protein